MPRTKTDLRIHDEISYLSNKISEIEQQLREEKKVHSKLQHQLDTKLQQLNSINDEIKDELTNFSVTSQKFSQETSYLENTSIQRIKELNEKKSKLLWELSANDVIENENAYLHKLLQQLTIDFHNDTLSRSTEMESYKQRAFDARMTMELVLRKEIQALDLNFKQRAIANIEEEASIAAIENRELFTELTHRQQQASELINNQQTIYETLQKIEIEHEVMLTASDTYEKQIVAIQELFDKAERKKNRLERSLDNIQYEVNYNTQQLQQRYESARELLEIKKKYENMKLKKNKIKKKVMKLSQKIISRSMKESEENQERINEKISHMKLDEENNNENEYNSDNELSDDELQYEIESKILQLNNSGKLKKSNKFEIHEDDDYDPRSAWMTTQQQYPTIAGEIREKMITKNIKKQNDNQKYNEKKSYKTLLPNYMSVSMTQHNINIVKDSR